MKTSCNESVFLEAQTLRAALAFKVKGQGQICPLLLDLWNQLGHISV